MRNALSRIAFPRALRFLRLRLSIAFNLYGTNTHTHTIRHYHAGISASAWLFDVQYKIGSHVVCCVLRIQWKLFALEVRVFSIFAVYPRCECV